MAFFEELGEKVTKTGQEAMQKTRDFAGVTKLNMDIDSIRKENSNLFLQLGQIAYDNKDLFSDNAEAEEVINRIAANIAKIDEKNREISDIKGLIQCPNCGAPIPTTSVFCSNCGTKMSEKPQPATCSNCGAQLEENAKFCTKCGTPVA